MTAFLTNLFVVPFRIVVNLLEGLWALVRALGMGLSLLSGEGTIASRAAALFGQASSQRTLLTAVRALIPNVVLGRSFVKSYENQGTAVVTRREDVLDVLARDEDFEVVYGPRMRRLTGGENFFLGMQPGWDYERDTSAMRLAMRRDDVARIVEPRASELSHAIVEGANGRIDVPQQLTLQVPWDMVDRYFGTGGPSPDDMKRWTTDLFWYLFIDLKADPEFDRRCMKAAAEMREYLDEAVAARKAESANGAAARDDVLGRCLALQDAGVPGMDDVGIRNNLLGLLIGAIPTLSKASCLALDELFRRPDALADACKAARFDDDGLMVQHIWEALRFNPHNPVIYRRATRDTHVARSTLRGRAIPQGTLVFASNFAAMFDRYGVPEPNAFRTDRPWETYIHWGVGLHTCFGAAINRAVIPAMLKPLLARPNLRRAEGAAGQVDTGGTPFPQHFTVEFDAA